MLIEAVATDLWRIAVLEPDLVNVYLAGDVLIDSGGRFAEKKLLRTLEGRTVRAHAITHAHFDHQGCSHAVCERFGVPLWCGEGDRAAVESGDLGLVLPPGRPMLAWLQRTLAGPRHPVARALVQGEEVGGFTVLETPGHTPGHLAFWRARDRVLILGDVLFNRNPVTRRRGLSEPFRWATFDRTANLDAARRLALLMPSVVCFGHGAPLRNAGAFRVFASTLPFPDAPRRWARVSASD
jgi:glyoxylase-like metal-dependent hydrolase (beta-lactamase superfamily II)